MKFESKWLTLMELHVVHVRLRGELHVLIADHLLVRFLDERFDRFLANGVAEALADHGRRRLAWPEARQARGRGVATDRLFFGLSHHVGWHFDLQQSFDAVRLLFSDLEVHQRVWLSESGRRIRGQER